MSVERGPANVFSRKHPRVLGVEGYKLPQFIIKMSPLHCRSGYWIFLVNNARLTLLS